MKIYEYPAEVRLPFDGCAVALGFFDGVHLAHREIISATVKEARQRGIASCVFTFNSEEKKIKSSAKRIYSTEEKLSIIESLGIDAVVLADFGAVSAISPEEFVSRVLVEELGCRVALCGYNFRFGNKALGNAETLSVLMKKHGGEASVFGEFRLEGKELSSSAVREALSYGDMPRATKMLGSPYRLTGKVEHGLGNGKELGYPTLNFSIPESRALLRFGVYRTSIPIDGIVYTGVTNVGICPTFDPRTPHAETHLVDFNGDLYGRELCIFFEEFLREERSFPNKESLIEQIKLDTERAIKNKDNSEYKK